MANDPAAMESIHEQIATLTATVTTQWNQMKERFDRQANQFDEIGGHPAILETRGDGLLPTPANLAPGAPGHAIGGVQSADRPPCFHRLEFPKYEGQEDPLGWLQKCEQFFRGQKTPETEKVWLASYHLVDSAHQWYFQLERDEGEPNWRNFKEYLNLRFGPSIRYNSLGELKELTQTGTVEDYQAKFLAILCRANNLKLRQQVQLFTLGLREPIRTDVELQNPTSLQMAMALAGAYERRAQVIGQPAMPHSTRPATTPAKSFTTPNIAQPALPIVPSLKLGMGSE